MNGEHRSVMTSASVNICAPPATPRFRCIQTSDTKVRIDGPGSATLPSYSGLVYSSHNQPSLVLPLLLSKLSGRGVNCSARFAFT